MDKDTYPLSAAFSTVTLCLEYLETVMVENMNILKLLCLQTDEAEAAKGFQVHRQKCISNYRNGVLNKTPNNIGSTACSMTSVLWGFSTGADPTTDSTTLWSVAKVGNENPEKNTKNWGRFHPPTGYSTSWLVWICLPTDLVLGYFSTRQEASCTDKHTELEHFPDPLD